MVARIHHTKNGTEYVLQYDSRTDSIELRIIKHTLIGGIPNYFRDEWGTSFLEIPTFKEILRNSRTISGIDQFPELTEDEEALIHAFEEIADTHLLLTPESQNRFYQTAMQGAANGFQPGVESLRETARLMRSLDLQPLISATSRLAYSVLVQEFAVTSHAAASHLVRYSSRYADGSEVTEPETESDTEQEQNTPTEAEMENIRQQLQMAEELRLDRYEVEPIANIGSPPPTDEPPIAQETPSVNTEGMTEEEIQENEEFIQRLLNGETISARAFPLRNRDRAEETPQDAEADLDAFLNEIDDTLETAGSDADTIRAAPSHHPEIPVETMMHLWREARRDED